MTSKFSDCIFYLTATIRRCNCCWHSWTSLHIITGITKGLYIVNMCDSILEILLYID